MNEEVICVDGHFDNDWKNWAAENNVQFPEEGKIYTIRELVRHFNSELAVRLVEIVNPFVDPKMMLISQKIEPSFRMSRFRKLDMSELTLTEQIEELV